MEGSHSPFGFVWQIATATGWSINRILWKIPYPTLMLMIKDIPRYVTEENKNPGQRKNRNTNKQKTKGQSALDFFQTRLTDNGKGS